MKGYRYTVVLTALLVAACSSGSPNAQSSGGSSGTTTPEGEDGGTTEETPPVETPPTVLPSKLEIASATMRNVGRKGDTLRFEIHGTDGNARTSAAIVRLKDGNGSPVNALDTNWDGIADAAERRVRFDASTMGKTTFDGTLTIPGAFSPSSTVAKAEVALEDDKGERSAFFPVTLVLQAQRAEGEDCDTAKIESRCAASLSCSGTPSKCQAGSDPALAKVAYFGGLSPRVLVRGDDADEDISSVSVEFLDNAGNAKEVVIAGEGQESTSASSITTDARASAYGSLFFVNLAPSASFAQQVPKIGVKASDLTTRTSTRQVIAQTTRPVKGAGQACDADGFDACGAGFACFPGIRTAAANTCKAVSTMRTDKCKEQKTALDPEKGPTTAFGTAEGTSLWDPPAGCVPPEALGRPESAIPLHLGAAVAKLEITTALPETMFDTAVYVIPTCAATTAAALGCNDDTVGYSSTLTLENVPAGDYTIVVDSVHPRGGRFGVSVRIEK